MNAFDGPLRIHPTNPRYFTDDTGKAIYLTGSHTWANLVEIKLEADPDFDYDAWLDFMEGHNHNFMRLWTWDHPQMGPWTEEIVTFDPMPHARTGPGLARDGKPKFDLGRWNEAYFDRLRTRVIQAGERGIYVSVMLFEGWCIKSAYPASDPWPYHPYNIDNNVNGVDGDPDGDGRADVYSLDVDDVVECQKRYVRKVVETVNDLDNALYEICNETPNEQRAFDWQYDMVDFVHKLERSMPKQHPVGMTAEGGTQYNPILFESPADWISPGRGPDEEYKYDPPPADGSKVVLSDTDHLWGHGGNYQWAWKSFLRGMNVLFMDPWCPVPGQLRAGYSGGTLNNTRDYPDWEPLRRNLGYTRQYADRINLAASTPRGELSSSGFCLADPGTSYITYVPDDAKLVVDLSDGAGAFAVEWLSPRTGEIRKTEPVPAGARRQLVSPLGSDVVVALTSMDDA